MYYSDNNQSDNEKIYKALEKTLDMIKNINKYEYKVKSINEAISSNDHQTMVQEINKKWSIYKNFANSLSMFTNYYVYKVDDNFYDDKPIEYLVKQLNDIKFFVALKILKEKAEKELIIKVLKQFGILPEEEIKKGLRSFVNGSFNS